jgi:hypothetical protein
VKRAAPFLAAVILSHLAGACSTTAVLRVTPEHRKFLKPVSDSTYRNRSIDKLFSRVEEKGDTICEMMFQTKPYDDATAKEFSDTLDFRKDPEEKWYNNVLPTMLAGCFNFFKMNDRGVHKSFALIEELYPEAKDCFTVGFTQFYMMFQQMRCKRFVAIDIDWRILKAHHDFQGLVRANSAGADALSLLQQLQLGWVAHFDSRPPKREPVKNETTLCMETEKVHCRSAFDHFVSQRQLPKTELLLGFIHDADLAPREGEVSVIFASNALDWEYTSREQFNKLLESARQSLGKREKIAIVYQAGDSEDIAVYELATNTDGVFTATVRCRDNLRWSDRYKKYLRGKPIYTWFDEIYQRDQLKQAPRCHVGGTRRYITDFTASPKKNPQQSPESLPKK